MRWRLLTVSVRSAALAFSNSSGGLAAPGLRRPAICGMNSPTRRNFRVKTLLARWPLAGSASAGPSMKSGASV